MTPEQEQIWELSRRLYDAISRISELERRMDAAERRLSKYE
jgi:hypothetical protein